MPQIVPAILTTDPNTYKQKMELYQPFAKRVHVDIADGTFAPSKTIPLTNVWWPQGMAIDVHLMVARPSEHLPVILKLRPSLCIFHAEAGEDLVPIFSQLRSAGIKSGVALMKSSFPGDYKSFIEVADHVLVFAGNLGKQGGKADMLQTEKIPLIKAINPNTEIGWDGGASLQTVRAIAHAGADMIAAGAAISNAADPGTAFEELTAELDKRGVVV